MTDADYDKVLLKKKEWEQKNQERTKDGLKQVLEKNALCQSELDVSRYTQIKNTGLFTKHPKKDKGNLNFQSIKGELMGARYSKDWKDFAQCQKSN